MISLSDADWVRIAPDIAKQLFGEPTKVTSKELRWGRHGSKSLNLETGQWYDHEAGTGGGVTDLIKIYNLDIKQVLKQYGYNVASSDVSHMIPLTKKSDGAKLLSKEKVAELQGHAIVYLQYTSKFKVMRFPPHHYIKQKYAPFSENPDGTWVMRRPEGLLPIYYKAEHEDKPIIINEGEKAAIGCKKIAKDYDAVTWHGGATGWQKSDWSPIFNKEVYIFPDNDEAGKQCASELSAYLKKNGCIVTIAKPPADFDAKDDLWDAYEKEYFKDQDALIKYIICNPMKPIGQITFTRADNVLQQVTNPEWLIKDVCEKEALMCIFGKPKSGKSFIAISMACAIAKGRNFYGNESNKAPVLYLCGEGQRGVKRRLAAWQQGMYDLKEVPLYLSDRAVRVNEEDDFVKLKDEINYIQNIEGNIGMIIIDTFQRNFVGNENSAEDVGNFINKLDSLISEYKCCVCLVHHTGHGNGDRARGSSVLGASLDYEFKVERQDKALGADKKEDMYVTFEQTLNKDGQGMQEKAFVFKEVEIIGDGLNLTSGYLEETDVDLTKKQQPRLIGNQKNVLAQLKIEAMERNPQAPQDVKLQTNDLVGKVKDKKDKNLEPNQIQKALSALRDKNLVIHDSENKNWQHADYKDIPPNFDGSA